MRVFERTGEDLKCQGHEEKKNKTRKTNGNGKKSDSSYREQNDRKSGAIKESCVRGGAILRDGFPAGERDGKKTKLSGTNSSRDVKRW